MLAFLPCRGFIDVWSVITDAQRLLTLISVPGGHQTVPAEPAQPELAGEGRCGGALVPIDHPGHSASSWDRATPLQLLPTAAAHPPPLPPPPLPQHGMADKEELFDLVDEQDNVIGTELRSVVHSKGAIASKGTRCSAVQWPSKRHRLLQVFTACQHQCAYRPVRPAHYSSSCYKLPSMLQACCTALCTCGCSAPTARCWCSAARRTRRLGPGSWTCRWRSTCSRGRATCRWGLGTAHAV